MEAEFEKMVLANTPEPDMKLLEGLPYHALKDGPKMIDLVWRSVGESFPPGLKYIETRACTPQEQWLHLSGLNRTNAVKRQADMSRSDLIMYKFVLEHTDPVDKRKQRIEWPMLLPTASKGSHTYLGGSLFGLFGVLSDKMIAPDGENAVFVRLFRDKISVSRTQHRFYENGLAATASVITASIYRSSKNTNITKSTKAASTLLHYLFARYGVVETFNRYMGFEIKVETTPGVHYPPEQYTQFKSVKLKPSGYINKVYTPTNIQVYVPNEHVNNTVRVMMSSLFYLIDHFPQDIDAKMLTGNGVDKWKQLIGRVIFGDITYNVIADKIDSHFKSLEMYVDILVKEQLEQQFNNNFNGRRVDNFYDLLMVLIDNYDYWIIHSNEITTSIYEKRMEVLYYALYSIILAINNTYFNILRAAKLRPLRTRDIIQIMNKSLRTGTIFALTRAPAGCAPISNSTDNYALKVTQVISVQGSSGNSGGGKGTLAINDPSLVAQPSMLFSGTVAAGSKSAMSPYLKPNPFMKIDHATGAILMHPDNEAIIKHLEEMLSPSDIQYAIDSDDDDPDDLREDYDEGD